MLSSVRQSAAFRFACGAAVGFALSGAVYLVCDTFSDAITLRECQKRVLPLAVRHEQLVTELGPPLAVGPMFSSSLRISPTGRTVQCQFRLNGEKRGADVAATVQRTSHGMTLVHNLLGPATWDLANCHVLISAPSRATSDAR